MSDTWSPLEDLAEINADLEAMLAWERLCGGAVLPRAPAGSGEALFGPLPELTGAGPASRSPEPPRTEPAPAARAAPPRPEPPAAPAPPPADPARPSLFSRLPAGPVPDRWAALANTALTDDPAAGLARVREALGDCQRCGLCKERKNIVFGVGSPTARLLIVGEGPGAREDELGEPFVGAAGEMLDKMLSNVLKLSRAQVYILNVVKCRPPGNRDPLPEEIAACKPFLYQQIEAIRPAVILTVGRVAAQTLLETTQGMHALRGGWRLFQGRTPVMSTYHPAYLLRVPEDKKKTMEDLLQVKGKLAEISASSSA